MFRLLRLLLALFILSIVPVASGERGEETSAAESESGLETQQAQRADLLESDVGQVSSHAPEKAAGGPEPSSGKIPSAGSEASDSSKNREQLTEDTEKMEEARKAAEKKSDEAHTALKEYVKAKGDGVHAFEDVEEMVEATRKRSIGYFAAREVARDHPLEEIVHTPDMDDRREMVRKFQDRVKRYFSKPEETAGAGHGHKGGQEAT
eukprot:TRINITY_DN9117_c1_g1_i1.p1 TRINITY_DN9117_c1_g1~~TRINITY_DN9117_c1_g1_i1.p1  ORF type:complete len:207 (-),score=55.58 TRINITY_DN9117_c1_g1_i1:244-864(-)